MANKKNPGELHTGHRERMWDRYMQAGLDSFAEHEVLELLLMQILPRVDVNPLAHRLIARFGSLNGVLGAPTGELETVEGVGPKTARFLHLFPDLYRAYARSQEQKTTVLDTLDKVGTYLQALYIGETEEKLYMLVLDNGMRLCDCHLLAEGTVNQVSVSKRKIIEHVIRDHASCVILAHNHPHGLAIPSSQDRQITAAVDSLLHELGVCLVEHIIVTDHTYTPTMGSIHDGFCTHPVSEHFNGEFFTRFYHS